MRLFVVHAMLLLGLACSCTHYRSDLTASKKTSANPLVPDDPLYKWFQAQDQRYFAQVAGDCDLILRQHPLGSAGLRGLPDWPDWFTVSVESLPATVGPLHPQAIMVTTNRIWIGFRGRGDLDWGVMWGRSDHPAYTNTWVLRSCIAYGYERTLYAISRP
jgi:hypothetical protein